jgi:hypothetical protein
MMPKLDKQKMFNNEHQFALTHLHLSLLTIPEARAAEEIKAAYGIIYFMADSFDEVQQKLEEIVSKLKSATDPTERRTLLREMSRLLAETQRISFKPPK